MSVISFRESVALGAVETIYVEVARPFINAITFSVFSSAVLAGQVGIRVTASGQTLFPVPANGADNDIWLENHAPLLIVANKEIVGPPYRLEIRIDNTANAAAVFASGVIEVYNSAYPQTRIKISPGHETSEGLDFAERWRIEQEQEKESKKGTGK